MDPNNFANLVNAVANTLQAGFTQNQSGGVPQGPPPPTSTGRGRGGFQPNFRGRGPPQQNFRGNFPPQNNYGDIGTPQHNFMGQGAPQHNFRGQVAPQHNFRGQGTPQHNFRGQGAPQHNYRGKGPAPHHVSRGRGSSHPRGAPNSAKSKTQRGSQSLGNLSHNYNEKKKGKDNLDSGNLQGASGFAPSAPLYEPPPSYNEAMSSDSSKSNNKNTKSKASLDSQKLVKVLSSFRGFWNSLQIIAKLADSTDAEVLKVVKNNSHIFSCMKDSSSNDTLVELCPRIGICYPYLNRNGCTKEKCIFLHICGKYVAGSCKLGKECTYGHQWRSGHNSSILSRLHLDSIDEDGLMLLVKKSKDKVSEKSGSTNFPIICSHYNKKGCTSDCCDLHICFDHIMTLGACSKAACSLNHNVFDPKVCELLRKAEISTNESPRDLMRVISQKCQGARSSNSKLSKEKKPISENKTDNKESEKKSQKVDEKKQGTKHTVTSNDLFGDVETLRICLFGLNNNCRNFQRGCKMLHASKPFHWQFNAGKKWYNLLDIQVRALEENFKDPSCSRCSIPPLKADSIPDRMKLLLTLLGSGKSINADFNMMVITGEAFTETRQLRRLSTISSVLNADDRSTVFKWYFRENDGNWKMYDTNQGLSSEEIEKAYQNDLHANLVFSVKKFKYKISFSEMMQTNLSTMKQRRLRRRPKGLVKQEKVMPPPSILPSHWVMMDESEVYSLSDLDPNSVEFEDISRCIRPTFPNISILSINRIQNPHLWKQYTNKKKAMEANKEYPLNVTKLFHGLEKGTYRDICCNNLDFRLHEGDIEMDYGNGAYFYNSAAYASCLSSPNASGIKRLLVAEVILGTIAAGSKGLSRPPYVDGSDDLYDTTVDNPNAPTLFVKYNKQEYYPAYLVCFR